jgi:hypothetical protein
MEGLRRTVSTAAGPLLVLMPDGAFLEKLARWPRPVLALQREEPPGWGLVFYDAAGPVLGVRVAFGWYTHEENARDAFGAQRLLIPASLAAFRRQRQDVTMMACAYLRSSGSHWQTGFAVFVRSEAAPERPRFGSTVYDADLGPGGTETVFGFVECAAKAWSEAGLPDRTITDVELVTLDDCGALAFDFLLAGDAVAWLRAELDAESPLVREAVRAGLTELVDLPSIPVRLSGEARGAAGASGEQPPG